MDRLRSCRALRRSRGYLIVNPAIRTLQTITQTRRWFPSKNFLNQGVVAVAAVHAFRRGRVVIPFQLQTGDVLDNIDELINRDELTAAKIQRFCIIAVHDYLRASYAIVDPLKAAGLFSIAPNLDLMFPGKFCFDHFAANRRRRFLAAAIVGSVRAVNVVITRDASRYSKILEKMAAHPLRKKFFPAVTVLGHRGVSVSFVERSDIWIGLLVRGIHASG